MQETRYFDNDELKTLQEVFEVERDEAMPITQETLDIEAEQLRELMDNRLAELQKQGHFLSERRPITRREAKDLRKKFKKFARKDRKAAMAKYKVTSGE